MKPVSPRGPIPPTKLIRPSSPRACAGSRRCRQRTADDVGAKRFDEPTRRRLQNAACLPDGAEGRDQADAPSRRGGFQVGSLSGRARHPPRIAEIHRVVDSRHRRRLAEHRRDPRRRFRVYHACSATQQRRRSATDGRRPTYLHECARFAVDGAARAPSTCSLTRWCGSRRGEADEQAREPVMLLPTEPAARTSGRPTDHRRCSVGWRFPSRASRGATGR